MAIQYNYNNGQIIERENYHEMFERYADTRPPLSSLMEVSMSANTYTASTSVELDPQTYVEELDEKIKELRAIVAKDLGLKPPKEKKDVKVIYRFDPEELVND